MQLCEYFCSHGPRPSCQSAWPGRHVARYGTSSRPTAAACNTRRIATSSLADIFSARSLASAELTHTHTHTGDRRTTDGWRRATSMGAGQHSARMQRDCLSSAENIATVARSILRHAAAKYSTSIRGTHITAARVVKVLIIQASI